MAVSDHVQPLGARTRVKILTVDPATRRIEAMLKDGSMIHVAVWDVPTMFRWPNENEEWIVRRHGTIWMLDQRVQTVPTELAPITGMTAGEAKIDANVIIDASGKTFVAVDLTGIVNGWTLKWNSTLNCFVASP